MLRFVAVFVLAFFAVPSLRADNMPCGLREVKETTSATYLPLARAAHVQGQVILLAEFVSDGSVNQIKVLSGPAMLTSGAVEFVKGWRANPYGGSRTCPIVITYSLDPPDQPQRRSSFTDAQHYTVFGQVPCLCDPPIELGKKRKRFLIF